LIAIVAASALLAVKGSWAAYRDGAVCRALAEPVRRTTTKARPFAALAVAPGRLPVLSFRLGRPSAGGKATMIAGGRDYALTGTGDVAVTSDPAAIDAFRAGSQTVTVRTRAGYEIYATRGAATAFDAVFAACR
jgi:hypothetical protein